LFSNNSLYRSVAVLSCLEIRRFSVFISSCSANLRPQFAILMSLENRFCRSLIFFLDVSFYDKYEIQENNLNINSRLIVILILFQKLEWLLFFLIRRFCTYFQQCLHSGTGDLIVTYSLFGYHVIVNIYIGVLEYFILNV
jgi:hypothetical protein